jgi:CheY-like chemotaxis protein
VTVLIVEDEEHGRETLRDLLEDEGYHVMTARDGSEAMERLAVPGPSLVILDLRMPGLNGVGVYDAMQRSPQLAKIPVLVTTAVPELAPPGVPTLEKPIKVDKLLQLVALACGQV